MTAHQSSKTSRRISSLDGLRGLAALVVLIHHVMLLFPTLALVEMRKPVATGSLETLISFTPLHLFWAGDEAVIIFFVLSGLALALSVLTPSRSRWRAYYPSRLVRLYGPVFAVVAAAALLFLVAPWGSAYAGAGPVLPLTAGKVLHDASLVGSASELDGALWSLHYEVIFSLLLPLYVYVVRRSGAWWPACAIAALLVNFFASAMHLQILVYLPVFALGVVLALRIDDAARLRDRIEASRWRHLVWGALAIGSALGLVVGWYPLPQPVSGAIGWPVLLISGTVIVYLGAFWPLAVRVLTTRPLHALGVLSFSLYLVHGPILGFIGHLAGPTRPWLALVLTIPISLLAAWLFHRAVEKPSHRLAQHLARRINRGVLLAVEPTVIRTVEQAP